jgi:hypothetical protein
MVSITALIIYTQYLQLFLFALFSKDLYFEVFFLSLLLNDIYDVYF